MVFLTVEKFTIPALLAHPRHCQYLMHTLSPPWFDLASLTCQLLYSGVEPLVSHFDSAPAGCYRLLPEPVACGTEKNKMSLLPLIRRSLIRRSKNLIYGVRFPIVIKEIRFTVVRRKKEAQAGPARQQKPDHRPGIFHGQDNKARAIAKFKKPIWSAKEVWDNPE